MYIKSNADILCAAWATDTGAETSSCTAVAQLVVGDTVRVTGDSDNHATIRTPQSLFVGHIISDNLSI